MMPDHPIQEADRPGGPGRAGPSGYRVLARRYRPQRLSELIGQEALVRTLGNALRTGRIAHAFLLTGIRGVGKTSTARIIARALNCIGPDGKGQATPEPCGVCEPCVAIAESRHIDVLEMDAANLTFEDNSFDIVYAPYLISVVPDPVKVVREMRRVCRPGGRIIVLNHFRSANRVLATMERAISPLTVHIGFKSDLDLPGFLAQADLQPISIEKVNVPKIWSLVTCRKD